MKSARSAGRVVGVLVLAHLVAGLMVPFILLDRVRGSAGFLANAASHPVLVPATVLLLFAGSALASGIAIAAFPVLRQRSSAAALWLIVLGVAAFCLQSVDNGRLMSLLSLSQEYTKAGPDKADLFQALYLVAASARKWAHYSYLLVAVGWIFLLFGVMFRFRLVPRLLAVFGLITSLSQIVGVTLRVMFGYPPAMWAAIPLAPVYVALALWLMVKGFEDGIGRENALAAPTRV